MFRFLFKSLPFSCIAVLLIFGISSATLTERREAKYLKSRVKIRCGENWKVNVGNTANAQDAAFNDVGWTTTSVPHDMSITLVKPSLSDPGAIGWYRYHFTPPATWAGKKVIVQFDGVYQDSKVYLNGVQVGGQKYGYSNFTCDLTSQIKIAGDNVLAVLVDNQTDRRSRWYSGTGIFRHVWLIATDKVYIQDWGTAVTTVGATAASADVSIKTEIANDMSTDQTREIVTVLCDSNGVVVDTTVSSITVKANSVDTCKQKITVTNCKLWSPSTPYIYNAYTKVLNNKVLSDDYITPFGIRDIKYEANKGFSINGVVTKMKGVCVHHMLVPAGAAVPEQMWARCLRELLASGSTMFRTSHNQMAPEFYDLCDKMGMLVMDEWCDKWNVKTAGSYYGDFGKEWHKDLSAFLRCNRNHPSVVMWSVGNEVSQDGIIPQWEFDTLGKVVKFGKTIEATRPYTHGCVAGWNSDVNGFAKLAQYEDIIGVNYQDWMYGQIHSKVPNALIAGTEQCQYLTGGSPTWFSVKNNAYVVSHSLWTGLDYLGESGNQLGSASGYLDNCNFRKTWFYYMQSQWTTTPMVKVGIGDAVTNSSMCWSSPVLSESWNNKSGAQNVVIYSNCESVDLYVNSTKIGSKNVTGNLITQFANTNYQSGVIKVVGIKGGQQVAFDSIVTVGDAAKIVLKTDRTTLFADGEDVANIEAYVADANGRHLWDATNSISYTVTGNGRGIGIGSGDWRSTENFKASSRKAFNGRVLIPVQSLTKPGSINVTVSASGLTSGTVTLTTVAEDTNAISLSAPAAYLRAQSQIFDCIQDAKSKNFRIRYSVETPADVSLSILSPLGRTIKQSEQKRVGAGIYTNNWNVGTLNGVYFIVLKVNDVKRIQKIFAVR